MCQLGFSYQERFTQDQRHWHIGTLAHWHIPATSAEKTAADPEKPSF
jgi:hypothetical protein